MKAIEIMPPFNLNSRLADLELALQRADIAYDPPSKALYALLTDAYRLVVEVGDDEHRLQQLTEAIRSRSASATQANRAKTVAAKMALWLFRNDRGELVNKSTRSLYKRALERAEIEHLTPEEFHARLEAKGVFAFATKALLPSSECDDTVDRSVAPPTECEDPVHAARRQLLTGMVPGMSPISFVDNAPPHDTFVFVMYRADFGQLIPCFVTDNSSDVNAVLRIACHPLPVAQCPIDLATSTNVCPLFSRAQESI